MRPASFLLWFAAALYAQSSQSYSPGVTFQTSNPNYPVPNPFYFEGKIDWELLGIQEPANTWEFMQRGIHKQDELGDPDGAIADYESSLALNSLTRGTCQIVNADTLVNGTLPSKLDPAPCMFTVRLRLAHLLRLQDPARAISLYREVLRIDPLRPDVNAALGREYLAQAQRASDEGGRAAAFQDSIAAFQAELALSPVTPQSRALTGDEANHAAVHWELAGIYQKIGSNAEAINEYQLYLKATQWHSDVYPWRMDLAKKTIQVLQGQ
jgi:tetratricopeptide (TPR) repeat protein